MLIMLSEEIIDIIDDILTNYCDEYDFSLDASRALGALRNAVTNTKNCEELIRKAREYCTVTDTSLSDYMDKRINEVAQKGLNK